MSEADWTRERLMEVSGGYWAACALHAGLKLRVFDALGAGGGSVSGVAAACSSDGRGVVVLLNALAAMGLLSKEGDHFANTPVSLELLCTTSPHYLGHILLHHHHLMERWARLPEAVRSGRPVAVASSHTRDEAEQEAFLMGMFNIASGMAPRVVKALDLSGRRRLLDLGGGPGTYAIQFCLENPGLSAVIFDLPGTRPFAEKTVERFGLSGRVGFAAGDFNEDPLPSGFDVAWLSQILHGEGPEDCARLVAKAAKALLPGGILLIHEFLLEDTMDRPLHPALFSLNMLVGTEKGQSYSEGQVRAMMEGGGLHDIRRIDLPAPATSAILCGTK
jgi:SAM-dependent methyltransferase